MNSLVIMHECRDKSEIYNCQRIRLSHNGILVVVVRGGGGGVRWTWFDCNEISIKSIVIY